MTQCWPETNNNKATASDMRSADSCADIAQSGQPRHLMPPPLSRLSAKCRRALASTFARRTLSIGMSTPIISFTFDDAPVTAFRAGAVILKEYGVNATYFVSLGLL